MYPSGLGVEGWWRRGRCGRPVCDDDDAFVLKMGDYDSENENNISSSNKDNYKSYIGYSSVKIIAVIVLENRLAKLGEL